MGGISGKRWGECQKQRLLLNTHVVCVAADVPASGRGAEGRRLPPRPHSEKVSLGAHGPHDQGEAAAVGPSGAGSEAQSQVCYHNVKTHTLVHRLSLFFFAFKSLWILK